MAGFLQRTPIGFSRAYATLAQAEQELACADGPADVVMLHPASVQRYLDAVEGLTKTLREHETAPTQDGELANNVRSLIEAIVSTARPKALMTSRCAAG